MIEIKEYKNFDGIKISTKCTMTWELDEGDWAKAELEIINVKFNWNNNNFINHKQKAKKLGKV